MLHCKFQTVLFSIYTLDCNICINIHLPFSKFNFCSCRENTKTQVWVFFLFIYVNKMEVKLTNLHWLLGFL